jgi:hypothetical protein
MRMSMTFDTGAERYSWLNHQLFMAEGRLAGPLELYVPSLSRHRSGDITGAAKSQRKKGAFGL